jgi:hypothetical protein
MYCGPSISDGARGACTMERRARLPVGDGSSVLPVGGLAFGDCAVVVPAVEGDVGAGGDDGAALGVLSGGVALVCVPGREGGAVDEGGDAATEPPPPPPAPPLPPPPSEC